jgi:hypothetical protein
VPAFRTRVEVRHRGLRQFDFNLIAQEGLKTLLRDQFWCWMHDAAEENGLLRHYGFTSPRDEIFTLEEPANVLLAPFGIGIRTDQAQLFVSRHEFEPVIVSMLTRHVTRLTGPTDGIRLVHGLNLLRDLFAWIGSYERWAVDSVGAESRSRTLEMPLDMVESRPQRWWTLALRVSGAVHQTPKCSGRPLASRVSLSLG